MTIEHPFAATLAQMRKKPDQGGGFANLNDQQKWEWHADVYAFEGLVMNRQGSPCDPGGRWHNAALIGIAERYYRAKYIEPRERARAAREEADAREGRAIINAWARQQGHADLDAYIAATGIEWSQAYIECATGLSAGAAAPKRRGGSVSVGAALGLKATEIAPDAPFQLPAEDDPRVQARLREMAITEGTAA